MKSLLDSDPLDSSVFTANGFTFLVPSTTQRVSAAAIRKKEKHFQNVLIRKFINSEIKQISMHKSVLKGDDALHAATGSHWQQLVKIKQPAMTHCVPNSSVEWHFAILKQILEFCVFDHLLGLQQSSQFLKHSSVSFRQLNANKILVTTQTFQEINLE